MEGITVRELRNECDSLIRKGLGGKTVLISCDDEGNGFHTLFYTFVTDKNEVEFFKDMFHDGNDPDQVVLLG